MVPETGQATGSDNTSLYLLTNLVISIACSVGNFFLKQVKETSKVASHQARFFYRVVLYWLTDLPIASYSLSLLASALLSRDYFPQTEYVWFEYALFMLYR